LIRSKSAAESVITLFPKTTPIQGCQIFLGKTYQNGGKCTKLSKMAKWP
jgi:hypothetical protein